MLVLTRKPNEEVVIQLGGRMVFIRVLEAGNGRVRIGVDAPRDVAVHRLEVWKRIEHWNSADRKANCTAE
jgi:carbon storage regulator